LKRCGFIAVLGETNAGKSTLINKLVGQKVAIVSRKQQTTLTRINGIAVHGNSQIIFVDTPGFLKKKKVENLERIAWNAFRETDLIMFVIDANKKDFTSSIDLLQKIDQSKNIILVLNKVDLIHKPKLLELVEKFRQIRDFAEVFMISALRNKGVNDLKSCIAKMMPEGEWLYNDDEATDQPFEEYVAEITREHIYDQVHQEVPYKCAVITRSYEQPSNNHIVIYQDIHVTENSHKIIIIGHAGSKIKSIGMAARSELSRLLDKKVDLFLQVIVDDNNSKKNRQ